uniref:Formin-like 1a n=1 Tax=Cyprinus carpio TaxID=7962 RepID=A0A8C2DW67_CYPCA
MEYFMNDDSNIDFMVACMQFINIVVHSVENMNVRVHLQYEFTQLGLDKYLESLKEMESEKLQVQIQAYLDNLFDVGALLEDAENKGEVMEHLAELQETNAQVNYTLWTLIHLHIIIYCIAHILRESCAQVSTLQQREREREIQREREREQEHLSQPSEVDRERNGEVSGKESKLEMKLKELEEKGLVRLERTASGSLDIEVIPVTVEKIVTQTGRSTLTIYPSFSFFHTGPKGRKPIQPKFKMPLLNWQALKPNQVTGTVFGELNDEQVLGELNMDLFAEQFKTKAQSPPTDLSKLKVKVAEKAPSKVSLLEANKAKNLAITLRKGGMSPNDICTAIERYDQQSLSLDFLELLERFIPSEFEMKLLQNYEKEGRPLEDLSDEDRFMVRFGKIPRLAQRINTLTFMGNFPESMKRLQPQLDAIIAASVSLKSSSKLKKMLEIILAFGNYMNSSKRGAAYGFRLQSLDLLLDTKSTDRTQTLMHFIANMVQEKYPELAAFHTELRFVDKAALVSLDSVLQDLRSLERGMEGTKKEFMVQDDIPALKEFVKANSDVLDSLVKDGKAAQVRPQCMLNAHTLLDIKSA